MDEKRSDLLKLQGTFLDLWLSDPGAGEEAGLVRAWEAPAVTDSSESFPRERR